MTGKQAEKPVKAVNPFASNENTSTNIKKDIFEELNDVKPKAPKRPASRPVPGMPRLSKRTKN